MKRIAAVLLVLVVLAGCSSDGDDATPTTTTPTTEPPPPLDVEATAASGGKYGVPYNPMPTDIEGYTEEELFLSGTAESFTAPGELAADGTWALEVGPEADYTTRVIVRHPEDADDFNGTVLVEWLNVTAGRDSDPDWGFLHPYLRREGYAYVGVSAQKVGVEGGPTRLEIPGVPPEATFPLKQWDPERYGSLSHPGDEWSYGIFSDVARLLRRGELLDGLRPERLLAAGESQSASRLTTYVNGVHPIDHVYDGFLIHSRGATSAGIDAETTMPNPVTVRTDLDEPVLLFETETDLLRLGFLAARQDDTDSVRTWEVAGTAHADQSTLDYGEASGNVWLPGADVDPGAQCGQINDGPQAEVLRAAVHHLRAWVVDGTLPPTSPRIETTADDIVVDANGNAKGGIRTPPVDAPRSALSGKGNPVSVFCSLFGQETPFDEAKLAALYPTDEDYAREVKVSAVAAFDAGFLLAEERDAFFVQG